MIAVERMVQYEVLKEKWHKELQEALAKDSEELNRYLNPPYCSNNNTIVGSGNENENDSVEVQQQAAFAKIVAQVIEDSLIKNVLIFVDTMTLFLSLID